jgi:hypothetical protein
MFCFRETASVARLGDLLLLKLLSVKPGQTLTATATPGTRDLAGLATEVGDDLAAAVTGHADPRLLGLGCCRLGLVLLAFVLRGATARALGTRWLAIVCVTHGPHTTYPRMYLARAGCARRVVLD